jgi:hypothetical protein
MNKFEQFFKFEQVTHMNKKEFEHFLHLIIFRMWTKSWVQTNFVYEQILKFKKSLNQKTIQNLKKNSKPVKSQKPKKKPDKNRYINHDNQKQTKKSEIVGRLS